MKNKFILLTIILGILGFINLICAIPQINFTSLTPANNTFTGNVSVIINSSVIEANLGSVIWNWNTTNYTIYNNSLVLIMNFDNLSSLGESSTKVVDISNYSNNASVTSATWNSSGKYGGAYQYSGNAQYLSIADSDSLDSQNFTVSAWVKNYAQTISWNRIISKKNSFSDANGWEISLIANNYTALYVTGTSNTYTAVDCVGDWRTGWHHVLVVYNGSSGIVYCDGAYKGVSSISPVTANSQNLTLGKIMSETTTLWNGTIDEVKIWNTTLSASQAYEVYATSLQKFNSTQWYFYVNQSKNASARLDNGIYTYQVFATNTSGNLNNTEIRTLNLDLTNPLINFTSPTPANRSRNPNAYPIINVSIIEQFLNNITYNWNGTNYTLYKDDIRIFYSGNNTNDNIYVNFNSSVNNWAKNNLTNGLVLAVTMNNNSFVGDNATSVADLSGNKSNGNISGVTWNSSCMYGGCFDFNSVNGTIKFGYLPSIMNVTEVTFAFFAKTKSYTGSNPLWFGCTESGGNQFEAGLWGANPYNSAYFKVGTDYIHQSTTFNYNTWLYWTFTYNGSASAASRGAMYINGLPISTEYSLSATRTPNLSSFNIGSRGTGNYINASIDEFRIWNRSLSAAEVYQLYYSNELKLDSNQWNLQVNQSKNSTSGLDSGNYTYQVFANDLFGNGNQTEQRTLGVDDPIPVSYVPPTPTNYTGTNNSSVLINVSISSDILNQIKWNWNGTNFTLYNDSLVLMMNFDNVSSLGENSSYAVDVSRYGNNGTLINGTLCNSSGKYNGAMQFDGINDYIQSSNNIGITGSQPRTISAWIKNNNAAANWPGIIGWGTTASNARFTLSTSSGIWKMNLYGTEFNTGINVTAGVWLYHTVAYNGSDFFWYINSSLIASGQGSGGAIDTADAQLLIGVLSGEPTFLFNGSIDEVKIWNRSLSPEEVYQLYVSNLQKFNSTQWYLYVNQSKNSTAGFDNGSYTYFASATDSSGNENTPQIRTIFIDSGNPNATLISPSNNTLVNNRTQNYTVNITDNLGIKNATINIYNTTSLVNQTTNNYSIGVLASTLGIVVSVVDGTYKWFYSMFDWAGNSYATGNYTIMIDATYPQINFTSPTPGNNTNTTNGSVIINVSVSEANLNSVIWNWNGTNYTMYNDSLILMYNFDNVSSLGENSSYAVDSSVYGNNATMVSTTWNTSGKYKNAMSFASTNNRVVSLNQINITNAGTMSAWIYANTYPGNTRIIGSVGNVPVQILADNSVTAGGNNLSVNIIQEGTNRVIDSSYSLTTGRWIFVAMTFNSSTLNMYVNGTNVFSNVTSISGSNFTPQIGWDSANNLDYWNGLIDEVRIWNRSLSASEIYEQYVSNLQKFNSTQWYFNINQSKNATAGLDIANYTYQIFANDTVGNINQTEQKTIKILSNPPQVNFTSLTPVNNTNTSNTSILINVSISTSNLSSLIYNWNGTNYTMYNNSLLLMYNFDNVSSLGENSTIAIDSSVYGNNGTLVNGTLWNSSGKYNSAIQFDGINDYIRAPLITNKVANVTISAWFKTNKYNQAGQMIVYVGSDAATDGYGFSVNQEATTDGTFYGLYGGVGWYDSGRDITDSNWHHGVLVINSTGSPNLYLDGAFVYGTTGAADTPTNYVEIGRNDYPAARYFNGSIDEVRIWNRSLSASEIYEQYVSNVQKFNSTQYYLYVNQSKNATAGLTNGSYTYVASAIDSNNYLGQTEIRYITSDSGNPNATLISPTNNTLVNNRTQNYTVNITDNLGIKNATINIYNTTSLVNQTTNNYSIGVLASTLGIVVSVVDGTYKWFYSMFDWAGNSYATGNYTIMIDATYPQINFTSPTPANNTNTTNSSIIVNATISEVNLSSLTYNWNNTNYTMYNDSLVLMYNFDNVSSLGENATYSVDVSKYGNNGTIVNAVWNTSGKYNSALTFDGNGDYIDLGITNSTQSQYNITLSAWVKTSATTNAYRDIIANQWQFQSSGIMLTTYGTSTIHVPWSNGSVYDYYDATYTVADGNWHFIATTFSNGNLTIYADGINLGSKNSTTINKIGYNGANHLLVGKDSGDGGTEYWNGSIDEVRIWNRTLSSVEIYEQYISNLQKFNSTQYYLYVNQSKNATAGLDIGNYTYRVFANDSFGNLNQTEQRTIRIIPTPAKINLDILTPLTNINVSRNEFFSISVNVTCLTNDCGNLNISLDPINLGIGKEQELSILENVSTLSAISLYDNKSFEYDIQDGCFLTDGMYDTFDSPGLRLKVNGTDYTGTRSTLEDSNREAICIGQNMSGINVSRKVYVPNTENWARFLEIFHNANTTNTICIKAGIYNDMGSDGSDFLNTSDGDTTWEITDHWLMWDDTSSTAGDSPAGFIYHQDNASVVVNQLLPTTASGGINQWNWTTLCIAPGQTKIIMHFFTQWTTRVQAENESNIIYSNMTSNSAKYYVGMSSEEISQVVNWASNSKGGLISTTVGATPFYTTVTNPYNLTLNENQSQVITWLVNATGNSNNTYEFFVYANLTSDASVSNATSKWNVTIQSSDTSGPSISLSLPVNNTNTSAPVQYFTANFTDSTQLRNYTLYIWNSSGSTINTTSGTMNGTSNSSNISVTLPYSNIFKWNYYACDNLSNCGFATNNFTLNYDNTSPYFTGIGNVSIYNNQSLIYDINATDSIAFDSFSINWTTNFTINKTNGNLTNSSALAIGVYWINVTINDSVNNLNSSLIMINVSNYILSDSTYPFFLSNSTSIANNTQYSSGNNYQFNITIINSNGTAGIEFDGNNYTMSNLSFVYNKTLNNLSAGNYSYYYWSLGNGTSKNFNKSVTYYYTVAVNSSARVYTYINNSRANLTIYNNTQIYLNASLINVTGNISLYKNNTLINFGTGNRSNLTLFNDIGIYNITSIYSENINYSSANETWWLNVTPDITYPKFSNYSDNNGSLYSNGIGIFNVSVINTNGSVWLNINNENITATNLSARVYNVSYTFASNGTYNYTWYSYGNGSSKNLNNSGIRTYYVNPSIGIINLTRISPLENIIVNKSDWFNVSINLTCYYSNCGGINVSLDPSNSSESQELCVYDHNGGGCAFTSNLCSDGYDTSLYPSGGTKTYGNSTIKTTNLTSYITSVTFKTYQTCNSPTFTFRMNGYIIGNTTGNSDCTCSPNPYPRTYTITNQTLLNSYWLTNNNNTFNITVTNSAAFAGFKVIINYTTNSKNGLINTTIGATPFYTNVSNPYNTNLNENESEIITWWINASGTGSNYTFFVYANRTSNLSLSNSTSKWNVSIYEPAYVPDNVYPNFYNYSDNNASITSGGTAIFSVNLNNTNGSVWIRINGTNYSASNASSFYNLSVTGLLNGTYNYTWYSYGNGSSKNFNVSSTRLYTINPGDTTPPIITIISPLNTTYRTNLINLSVSLNENTSWCSYSLNNAANISLSSLNISYFNLTNVSMNQGSNMIVFSCNDTSGNRNSTSLRYFSIDSIVPYVGFFSPLNNSYNTKNISLNITNNSDARNIWFNRGLGNETYNSPSYKTFSEGTNIIYAYANDSIGNFNYTNVTFFIDSISPALTVNSPEEKTYITNTIDFNISTNEDSYCWLKLNSTNNYTLQNNANRNFNYSLFLPDNTYSITYYCNDSLNNIATSSKVFGIKTVPPQISLNYPLSDRYYKNSTIQFNYTPMATTGISTCELWGNWTGIWHKNQSSTSITNYSNNYFIVNLSDGTYKWNVWCNNTQGLNDWSTQGNITFTIDRTPPVVNFVYPLATSYNSSIINIEITNSSDASSVWWNNGTSNLSYSSPIEISISDGSYTYIAYSNDSAGNLNNSNISFFIDTAYPIFSNYLDNNASLYKNGTGRFNVTIINTNRSVWLVINGTNVSAVNISANVYSANYTFTSNSTYEYYWITYNNGTSHLYSISDIAYYTVNNSDVISPNAILNTPINNTLVNNATQNFTANLSDNYSGIKNATLNIWNQTSLINLTTTNYSSGVLTSTVGIVVTLVDGIYKWFYNVFDYESNQFITDNRTLTIDTIAPRLSITSPSNNLVSSNNELPIEYVVSDNNLDSCWYSSDNMENNFSLNSCSYIQGVLWSTGNHNVSIWANDTSSNINITNVSFLIDNIAPSITLNSPSSSYSNDSASIINITFNCSAIDSYSLQNISLYITNNQNTSLSFNQTASISGTNNSSLFSLILYKGNYTWNCFSSDSLGNSGFGTNSSIILNFTDEDNDNIPDSEDNLEGNQSNVDSNGISNLNITIGGSLANGSFNEVQEIIFYDSNIKMINFTHNFTYSKLNLSRVEIIKSTDYIIVNLSGQLQENYNKTLYINDNNFASLCVKDAEISSISEVSSSCNGDNETDFAACIGNSIGVNISGINCIDEGNTIKVENLRYSAIRGTPATASTTTTTGSGSSGGGGGIIVNKTRYECINDSQCKNGYSCYNHKCSKLFDVEILKVSSFIDSFDFELKYLIKGMADIHGDVIVNFWIDKNGERLMLGKDSIYLGSFEEKNKTTTLNLPRDIKNGTYDLYVQVNFENYNAESYRKIDIINSGKWIRIIDKELGQIIETPEQIRQKNINIIYLLVIAILVILLLGAYKRRLKKLKLTNIEEINNLQKFSKKNNLDNIINNLDLKNIQKKININEIYNGLELNASKSLNLKKIEEARFRSWIMQKLHITYVAISSLILYLSAKIKNIAFRLAYYFKKSFKSIFRFIKIGLNFIWKILKKFCRKIFYFAKKQEKQMLKEIRSLDKKVVHSLNDLEGKIVYSANGNAIGFVKKIIIFENRIYGLVVHLNKEFENKKNILIKKTNIEIMKDIVIVKKEIEDVLKYAEQKGLEIQRDFESEIENTEKIFSDEKENFQIGIKKEGKKIKRFFIRIKDFFINSLDKIKRKINKGYEKTTKASQESLEKTKNNTEKIIEKTNKNTKDNIVKKQRLISMAINKIERFSLNQVIKLRNLIKRHYEKTNRLSNEIINKSSKVSQKFLEKTGRKTQESIENIGKNSKKGLDVLKIKTKNKILEKQRFSKRVINSFERTGLDILNKLEHFLSHKIKVEASIKVKIK